MSAGRRAFVAVGALTVLGIVAGPRPVVDVRLEPLILPGDLDAYLSASEGRVRDVVPGAEKTIVWANPDDRAPTPVSIVYLHGFSATRMEVSPLAETVGRELGANVFLTRLQGHGRGGAAMADATVNAWLHDAQEAMEIGRRIGERVIVMGTSTGATLATWAVAQERWRAEVLAAVLISPNYAPRDRSSRVLLLPWGGALARLVVGVEREWEPANELQARYWTTRYPTRALLPMMGLVDLVDDIDVGRFGTPLWMAISDEDQVIDAALARKRFDEWGGRDKVLVQVPDSGDPSHHVLAGDVLSPNTTAHLARQIVSFVKPQLD
jgi:esterase/lipase